MTSEAIRALVERREWQDIIPPLREHLKDQGGATMIDRVEWWTGPGHYNGKECHRCGRERVCLVEAPDGSDRAVCEKCGWDQEAGKYASELTFPAGEKSE